MASTTRAERRRQMRAARKQRHALTPDGDYGIQPGWFATLDDLEDAKRQSHDLLVASMGSNRTGGVEWRYWPMPDAKTVLAQIVATWDNPNEYEGDVLRRIGAHLREYGGYLIVALAEGKPNG